MTGHTRVTPRQSLYRTITAKLCRSFLLSSLLSFSAVTVSQDDSFATAQQRLTPLATIAGQLENPLPSVAPADQKDFSQSIALAKSKGSYSLLVWQGGKIQLEHYFPPYDASLRSESASMHKSVMALAFAAALDDGFIDSVDDPVSKYLPEWKDRPEGQITLRQLLTMTSGLEPLSFAGGDKSPSRRFYLGGPEAKELLLDMHLSANDGHKFVYANTNSQLLGRVLVSATGKDYSSYLSTRLWQPLGADDAYVWLNEPEGLPRTYTAFLARARDWLRVGLLIKQQGSWNGQSLIHPETIAKMLAPSAANPNYGWQIWRASPHEPERFYNYHKVGPSFTAKAPFPAEDMVYFDGFGGQRVYISPSMDLVIVRLGDARFDWDDSALPNSVVDELNLQ